MPPATGPQSQTETARAEDTLARWRAGAPPDAARAFDEFPELLRDRSLALGLVYEEYCLREEAGEALPLGQFCARFPRALRADLRELLRGHRVLAPRPTVAVGAWPQPGATVAELRVIRELGRGASSRAYLAVDFDTSRRVVLKLSTRASAEARLLGPLAHPNVVGVLWARRVGPLHAVCFPWLGSGTLHDVIRRRRVEPDAAPADPSAVGRIGERLAAALAYLHRRRLVHCDLKPSNVLLGRNDIPYLIDFDLACRVGAPPLRAGGTAPYLSPERVRALALGAAGAEVAPPADVWALGVTLYEALTGRLPFPPATGGVWDVLAALRHAQQGDPPPAVRDLNPAVPRPLSRVVASCLSIESGARPTAAEVRALLRPAPPGFWAVWSAKLLSGFRRHGARDSAACGRASRRTASRRR